MFNFKALALAATLAIGGVVGGIAPANAGTCWNLHQGARNVQGYYCHTQKRINANGHVVWDVTDVNTGDKFTFVFWNDNVVEIIGLTARPITRRFYTDRDGDLRIEVGGGRVFAIRL